ncbi:dTMP kinase [Fructobacillus sp. M2-14]|uniref:Thymidylate kinase n=1 Tax=Fructobacillus broussonetiae TaxID=2713173 RepID=A0ABS5QZK6_9LACO|nr:dTMP kinase [Fructobacillus broussonetiae]MBS9338648.1 dTMP kinase [Fructobacillus broussonetiae]
MNQRNFISFEGPEGAGKTTVINAAIPFLKELTGKDVLLTREPGGTGNPLAEEVRDILKKDRETPVDPWTEVFLLAASRREHVVHTIMPALKAGKIVLSDRYLDSSLAYQGGGRGLGKDAIMAVNDFAIQGETEGEKVLPELTIYLDLPVEIGLERIHQNRTDKIDRMDNEKVSFHKKVRETYLELAKENPDRIKVVDASQSKEDVLQQVKDILTANWR